MTGGAPRAEHKPQKHGSSSRRLAIALAIGLVAAAVAGLTAPWQTVPLFGWDAAAGTWILMVWTCIVKLDPLETSTHATAEDPGRATAHTLVLSASVASLVAVVLGIVKAANTHGDEKAVLVIAGVSAVVMSWAVVHTRFTLHYGALYYIGPDGGVDFNEDSKPTYTDFAYLAFTIGMTYQVSDTDITTREMRKAALTHALLSYLFGTVIIASAINLAAGLAH